MNRSGLVFIVAMLVLISMLGCKDNPTSVPTQRYSELSDNNFAVGDSSALEVNNFAGSIDVRSGGPGVVRVVATKWAGQVEDLDQIELEVIEVSNGVRVTATSPSGLRDVSVDLEITVPADTRPAVQNGAGATTYEGRAEGDCRFATAAGSIELTLPADVNVEVSLAVAAGSIQVDFPVNGQVSENVVEGTIGTGADGRIEAQVAAGTIRLIRK